MVNTSISVTVAGRTFPSVKACCEFFNIKTSKVYSYKSKNKCTAEEAIAAFLPDGLSIDIPEVKEEEVKEEVQETVEEKADEKETSNEHTSEEKSTEVKEEMADVNAKVDAAEEALKPITEEDSKLVIKKVDQKLNIFQKIKKFLFG